MNIVIDMDNTLTDEFGSRVRPGIYDFLKKLKKVGHNLILWTNSPKDRAIAILKENKLYEYFSKFIYREDYDPFNKGLKKDIRKVNGDVLIDDDPDEINFVKKINKKGILIKPFRKAQEVDKTELDKIYDEICNKKSIFDFFKK